MPAIVAEVRTLPSKPGSSTYDTLFTEPADGGDAWQRERMEYAFSLGAGLAEGDTMLTAARSTTAVI